MGQGDMTDTDLDPAAIAADTGLDRTAAPAAVAAAIAADAVSLAELDGGTGREQVRIDWLRRRLARAPGTRHVDAAGNLVWTFGPPPYRLAVLVHVDDVFGPDTPRGVTEHDGWLTGPGIGDNAVAVATTVAVAERELAPGPLVIVFTVAEAGLGALRGARHACRELAPEAVLALEGHGLDRVFTEAVGSLRVRLTVTGPGGHSWWDRGRPSAVHGLASLLHELIASAPARCPVNVGLIDGGSGVNAIAATASAAVEWRSTDQAELDQRAAALASLRVAAGLSLSAERLDSRPAGQIAPDHPLVAAVRRARHSVGLPDTTGDGSTDANAALAAGIPALALGCCTGDNMHAQAERIRVASIDTGARQLTAVIREVL
jgi:tripeptide aminopeptidase